MRDLLLRLIDVQRFDTQIAELSKGTKNLPSQLTSDELKLREARSQVETLEDEIKTMDRQRREAESNLKLEIAKVKKWEARLNDIRNQREYVALSREIEGAKRGNKEVEDRVLDLMETGEEKGKLLEALRDDLAVLEVDCDQLRSDTNKKIATIDKSIVSLGEDRDKLLADIPRDVVKRYERIRGARAGIALASVIDGQCQGCFMSIPPQLFNTLLRVTTMETCPYCSRILYWDGLTKTKEDEQGEADGVTKTADESAEPAVLAAAT